MKATKVKNYYLMSEKELDDHIERMRWWLFDNEHPKHPLFGKVDFALDVALNAKALKRDSFIDLVIEQLM